LHKIHPEISLISADNWSEILEHFDVFRQKKNFLPLVQTGEAIAELDPARLSQLTESEWQGMREQFRHLIEVDLMALAPLYARQLAVVARAEESRGGITQEKSREAPDVLEI
jgi:hypothetical protein